MAVTRGKKKARVSEKIEPKYLDTKFPPRATKKRGLPPGLAAYMAKKKKGG